VDVVVVVGSLRKGHVGDWFDENGTITNEKSKQFLQAIIDAFAAWIERVAQ
jgi:hypothetical protein